MDKEYILELADAIEKQKILLYIAALIFVYYSGQWLFRSYDSISDAISARIGALIILLVSPMIVYAGALEMSLVVESEDLLIQAALLPVGIFAGGAWDGLKLRRKRVSVKHNKDVLRKYGLSSEDDGIYIDVHGSQFRLAMKSPKQSCLVPLNGGAEIAVFDTDRHGKIVSAQWLENSMQIPPEHGKPAPITATTRDPHALGATRAGKPPLRARR